MPRPVSLIGEGGHATDIRASRVFQIMDQVAHHSEFVGDGQLIVIGIADPQIRAKVSAEIGVEDLSWIHPDAFIGPNCRWGYGTHIYHGVTMTRTVLGNHVQVAPGATICGDVRVGDRVFIGANATVVNLSTVPDDTFIKAGTVWTQR